MLLANQEHLRRWIPEQVCSAPPLPELVERLARFAAKFDAADEFRFAVRDASDERIIGGMSLFPRDATARVQLARADRIELGYWLDRAVTGRGFATEGAQALLGAAASLPGIGRAEIRCDRENMPSNAVPRRLGFELAVVDGDTQVWQHALVMAGDLHQ